MAIFTKCAKLEELQDVSKRDRKVNDNVILRTGKHLDVKSIGNRLNIDYHYKFTSLMGRSYSVGNIMRYISFKNAKPAWINTALKPEDHAFIKRNGEKRNVANFWNILTLVFSDRLLADKGLINDINNSYKGGMLSKLRIMPMIEVKRGLLKEVVFNDRLKVYGIITGIHVRLIVEGFRDVFGEDVDLDTIDKELYKTFKQNIKAKIIDRVFDNLKSDNLLDGLDSDANNDDVREAFLK